MTKVHTPKALAKPPCMGAGHRSECVGQTLECCPRLSSRNLCLRLLSHLCVCKKRGMFLHETRMRWGFNLKAPWCAVEKANAECPDPCACQMLSHLMKSDLCLKRSSTSCTEGDALQVLPLGTGCQHSVVLKRDWQVAGSARCHRGPGAKLCTRVKCGSFQEPRARP